MNDINKQLEIAARCIRVRDLENAEKLLTSLLTKDSKNTRGLGMLAQLKLDTGQHAAAADIYRKLLKAAPDSEEAVINLVRYHGARSELDQCESLLREALNRKPNTTNYHFLLANLLVKKGYHSRAIEAIKQAVDLEPDNIQILISMAEIYGRHGNIDKALDVIRPLLEAPTPHFQALVVFSNICLPLNMYEDCIHLIEKIDQQHLTPAQRQQLLTIRDMLEKCQL